MCARGTGKRLEDVECEKDGDGVSGVVWMLVNRDKGAAAHVGTSGRENDGMVKFYNRRPDLYI